MSSLATWDVRRVSSVASPLGTVLVVSTRSCIVKQRAVVMMVSTRSCMLNIVRWGWWTSTLLSSALY